MFSAIDEFAPEGAESGAALAVRDDDGRYLFILAGQRHRRQCAAGELFYAGIGGHREPGEGWVACARREAREEIGVELDVIPAQSTWYVPHEGPLERAHVRDRPRPLALHEMVHPPRTPKAGAAYRIVIYTAGLRDRPLLRRPDELCGVVALTAGQVVRGVDRRPTLARLLEEGADLLVGGDRVDRRLRLYPIGTARALARILPFVEARSGSPIIPPAAGRQRGDQGR